MHELLETGVASPSAAEINERSARDDVTATHLIARSTWIVHVGLALITGLALLVAVHEVQVGRIQLGEVFLFIAYVLIVHRRMIQVGRQLARSAKVVANVTRVGEILDTSGGDSHPPLAALRDGLELLVPGLTAAEPTDDAGVLDPNTLCFKSGTKTAVVDESGSCSSWLLRLCAGVEGAAGEIRWDGRMISPSALRAAQHIGYVLQVPAFPRRKLRWFIRDRANLKGDIARVLGLRCFVKKCPYGLKTTISSRMISRRRAQALGLARLLWDEVATVWLIDHPVSASQPTKMKRVVEAILDHADGRTVIVALPRPVPDSRFDRLIVIQDQKITFDGRPDVWLAAGHGAASGNALNAAHPVAGGKSFSSPVPLEYGSEDRRS